MGERTGIAWTDHTFNPWWGCTRISPGCDNCYADAWARRTGLKLWDGGPRRFMRPTYWAQPIQWNLAAAATGVRRRVFCGSMCDVFEDAPSAQLDVPREKLWQLIDHTPSLDWLLLTKRPENMPTLAPRAWASGWPQNVWAMTTCETQEVGWDRGNALLRVPAVIRGISAEPLLRRIDFGLRNWARIPRDDCRLDWIIVGCESGPRRRPCSLDDVRFVVEDCRLAGVAVFVKQLDINGRVSTDPAEWPEDLRIQEFPKSKPSDAK